MKTLALAGLAVAALGVALLVAIYSPMESRRSLPLSTTKVPAGGVEIPENHSTQLHEPMEPREVAMALDASAGEQRALPRMDVSRDEQAINLELQKAVRKRDDLAYRRLMIERQLLKLDSALDSHRIEVADRLLVMSIAEILRSQGRALPANTGKGARIDWEGGEWYFNYRGENFYFYNDEFPEYAQVLNARRGEGRLSGQGKPTSLEDVRVSIEGAPLSEELYSAVLHRARTALDVLSQ